MENFYNRLKNIVSQSGTFDRIIILGKGGSLREISRQGLAHAFIININDSERYFPGHVALFHSPWVYESIRLNGFKAASYVTNLELGDECAWIPAPYRPDTYDRVERSMALFTGDTFYLTDFLLLSALKIAFLVNRIRETEHEIYLLGFDFGINEPGAIADFSGHEPDFKQIFLKTQRDHFEHIKRSLDRSGLGKLIRHVGMHPFSALTVTGFNALSGVGTPGDSGVVFDNAVAYAELIDKIAGGHVLVVAEFTSNHIGDPERLAQMIRLARESGADMVKIQKRDIKSFYTPEELESPYESPFGTTLGDYRNAVEMDPGLMGVLRDECMKEEIIWFSSVLDYPSFQFIQEYHPPLIKLPSTISNHRNYLQKVAEEFTGDLVISTGFTDSGYEQFVLQTFTKNRNLFLLQTVSSYPAPPETCQIAVVRHYDHLRTSQYPHIMPGYSSHDPGSTGSMLAVAAGARMIEKHVRLGNLDWTHFDGVALDLQKGEFARFVKDIRKAEVLTGTGVKMIHREEHHKYKPNKNHN